MEEPSRIVCFHMNQMGDLLFSLPALYNLRARFPEAHIASIVRPSCKDLLALSGLVDDIIERPRGSFSQTVSSLRQKHFDLAVLFSTSFGMWALALLSGAKRRIGFTHSMPGLFLHQRIPWSPPPSTKNNLRLVEAIGCPIKKSDYVGLVQPGSAEQDEANQILEAAGIGTGEQFAVISPGTSSGREIKCWSNEKFAQVADEFAALYGMRSIVVGLDGGEDICGLSQNAVDLTGKTRLSILASVLKRSRVFIGVDSGVMHLAAAVGTPVIALFGPTDPQVTGPQGEGHHIVRADLPCRPCMKRECTIGRKCMENITTDMIISAVSALNMKLYK